MYSLYISSFMETKDTTCMSQASSYSLELLRRLDHLQGNTRYPFLLLFHIEDSVHFNLEGGGGGGGGGGWGVNSRIQSSFFKSPTFVSPYLF